MAVLVTKQRADYTFKFNKDVGRHGWLRLTPAYSVKLVDEILREIRDECHILDPFSGTGTTPLCSAYHGHTATGHELNPFLVWLGNAKTRRYSAQSIKSAKDSLALVCDQMRSDKVDMVVPPPIHNIDRWWSKERLEFLCRLMGCIQKACPGDSIHKDLLLVAFCRVMIDLSNAAFNHQSMSFKDTASSPHATLFDIYPDYLVQFEDEALNIRTSAETNPKGSAEIVMGDSRNLDALSGRSFDLLITSPPYPNRMSYIRELRPYMYWLGYLEEAREAGELDWQAIGGTWGIATSRLNEWRPSPNSFSPSYFEKIVDRIATSGEKNGDLLSRYVAKYFEDIWFHLSNIHKLMTKGGRVHYIIGNSVFYETVVPVERVYSDFLNELGFRDIEIKTLRKRNSKKALFEFDVTARR